ncbi:MAG: asparaginase [Acidobacteriota bacterium]
MERLVSVYRGDLLESFHVGSIAIVDSNGRLLAFVGDPSTTCFLRSSSKPFQAIPLLQEGGLEEFDLTLEEIALTCGSHGGEPFHVSTAAALLRKGELDESDLQCGLHIPYDEKAAAELRLSGDAPSVLQNNCSGKHAGMLLAAGLMDASIQNYTDPSHPLQLQVRKTLADFAGLTPEQIPFGVDGCGVPSYALPLYRSALAYARLIASGTGTGDSGTLPRYADSARQVLEAMTTHPDYVAGAWSITTPLMEAMKGQLIAKEGAEGFYSMGLFPELARELQEFTDVADGAAVGIAMKIADGSMDRGRNPAILRTLELVGLNPAAASSQLARYADPSLRNASGTVIGEVRAEFDLRFL